MMDPKGFKHMRRWRGATGLLALIAGLALFGAMVGLSLWRLFG